LLKETIGSFFSVYWIVGSGGALAISLYAVVLNRFGELKLESIRTIISAERLKK